MNQYDIDASKYFYNLTDKSTCIPADQFILLCQQVVFKTDAIKLGILCFFLGMGTMIFFNWLDKRWQKK